MSKKRAIEAYSAGIAYGSPRDLDASRGKYQRGYELLETALAADPDDIDLWDLRLGFLGNGAEAGEGADRNEIRLEAAMNLVRLNPDDDDAPFTKPYSGDYGGTGGLYYQLFQILNDMGNDDDDWPETEYGRRATEALRTAMRCRPEHREFFREEAEAVGVVVDRG